MRLIGKTGLAALALGLWSSAYGAPAQPLLASSSLIGLGFEDLMKIKVTTVSKREQRFFTAPSAVYVITADDIRRSGAMTIPDALRLAPGVEVAQVEAHTWAITARGFNATTANKLLVLIDGRSVYSPLFSGVFWDVQDLDLDDIDRIEVIRGPGAAIWGANAVNGVINIIRKPAVETQGGAVSVAAGKEKRNIDSVRYGGSIGERGHYRAYAKYRDIDASVVTPTHQDDSGRYLSGGFRSDWELRKEDQLTVQSDVYGGSEGQTSRITNLGGPYNALHHDDTDVSGGNVLSVWTHQFARRSSTQLQLYYDRTNRLIPQSWGHRLDTYDADFHHSLAWSVNEIVWGGGWRVYRSAADNTYAFTWDPAHKVEDIANLFFQDQIRVAPRVHLTLGSKLEHNDYTDWEFQPNVRLAWTPNTRNTLWGAVSRSARTPSRIDADVILRTIVPTSPLTEGELRGNSDFESEHLIAYELGYRTQPTERLFIDLASFVNVYDSLRTIEPGSPFLAANPTRRVFPFTLGNKMKGETYGVEFAPEWHPVDWWRLKGSYTYLHMRLNTEDGSADTTSAQSLKTDPPHQFRLDSSWDLPHQWELDGVARYVDHIEALEVPSYAALDARIGWSGLKNLELELIAQNLLKPRHLEYSPANEVEASYVGRATWHF